jgi:ribonucleoside-diphosphate reductase alpha chain
MRFEPAGMTDDPDIRMAVSVMDYIFRRLALDFLPYERRSELGIFTAAERAAQLRAEAALAGGHGAAGGDDSVDLAEMAISAPVSPTPPAKQAGSGSGAPVAGATSPAEATKPNDTAKPVEARPAPRAGSSTELLELVQGKAADAPLCFTCGTKMRPAGSCYVCEGCGSTSGCS